VISVSGPRYPNRCEKGRWSLVMLYITD
jgi:hypothetical protein